MSQDFWRLPKGVDEVLPPRARHLEVLRRGVLDLFDTWGYDYIEPPIIEYLDALLVGNDLNLQTLQVADQVSGRTLGVRADITSQAARIDANSLSESTGQAVSGDSATRRLCYAGPVVRANPSGVLESRVPLKAGAEIYGCADVSADLEIMCLAIDALQSAGVSEVVIELGHIGFVRHIVEELLLPEHLQSQLFEAVRIKSEADIALILQKAAERGDSERAPACERASDRLCRLVRLMGDGAALEQARSLFAHGGLDSEPDDVDRKLLELVEQLHYCAGRLGHLRPSVEVRFDLSAPVGFGYHQALVFALYDPGHGRAIARGGRYDGIGEKFGDARPATGFDLNLKTLLSLPSVVQTLLSQPEDGWIWVPFIDTSPLDEAVIIARDRAVAELRAQGSRVLQALSQDELRPAECTSELQHADNRWQAVKLVSP